MPRREMFCIPSLLHKPSHDIARFFAPVNPGYFGWRICSAHQENIFDLCVETLAEASNVG
jgi:hypothetical protein